MDRCRVKDRFRVRYMGKIWLRLELGFRFNVSVKLRWRSRVMVRCGWRPR